jgi:hypothetical protein
MNGKAEQEGTKGEFYDYGTDFQLLPRKEKRGLVKHAQTLLKLQKENALLADAPPLPMEAKKEGLG